MLATTILQIYKQEAFSKSIYFFMYNLLFPYSEYPFLSFSSSQI
jgi:hypothetical protein